MSPAAFASAIQSAADHLFMPWLVVLLLTSGLYLTLRYRVVQIRRFGDALAAFIGREDAEVGGDDKLAAAQHECGRRHVGQVARDVREVFSSIGRLEEMALTYVVVGVAIRAWRIPRGAIAA